MMPEEIPALVEGYRMRQDPPQGRQLHSWGSDDVMHNSQQVLSLYEDIPGDQQIRMFCDRSSQSVLDRNHGSLRRAGLDPIEHLRRARAGHHGAARQHFFGGFMTERAALALNGNFHLSLPKEGKV